MTPTATNGPTAGAGRPPARRPRGRVLALLALCMCFTAGAADMERGIAHYRLEQYPAAFAEFEPVARAGDPRAQAILGLMYAYGEGVAQDHAQSLRWYRRAAEQGLATAQYNVGLVYEEGRGVAPDIGEALAWYERAAEQGHVLAAAKLGRPTRSLAVSPLPRRVAASATTGASERAEEVARVAGLKLTRELSGASVGGGSRRYQIQIGSLRDPDGARRAYEQFRARHDDVLGELPGGVERWVLGREKGIWYRLRIGDFGGVGEARALCARLVRRDARLQCLAVTKE